MKSKKKTLKASRLIGPEDIRPGQYVTIAEAMQQFVCCACGENQVRSGAGEDVCVHNVTLLPPAAGWPFKVEAVCLPFALVSDCEGSRYALDLRRHRLARLSKTYGELAFAKDKATPDTAEAK